MHWLEKFRKNYIRKDGRKGISREELAAMVKLKHGKCSAVVIGIVENGGITHPNIADMIADIAGATLRQHDSMIHRSRRGGWQPPKPRRRSEYRAEGKNPNPMQVDVIPENARRVVALDVAGNEIGRYESISQAAEDIGCTPSTVSRRCNRQISPGTREFREFDRTWRFAEEWDAMSEFARQADIDNALTVMKRRRKNESRTQPE